MHKKHHQNMKLNIALLSLLHFLLLVTISSAQSVDECGGGILCKQGYCCSKYGFCGTTDSYCNPDNCESQCPPPPPSEDISTLISNETFEQMFPYRSTNPCVGAFYTYESFITATKSFPSFANVGDLDTRKREIAAFFAQTAYENTGLDFGPYMGGYCYIEVRAEGTFCIEEPGFPCMTNRFYYGRGPFMRSFKYSPNYGACGKALGLDLLKEPDLVTSDPVIAFKTALWFWMTPQDSKPSCHEAMDGEWVPTPEDLRDYRVPGFGLTSNIIKGVIACGNGKDLQSLTRVGFFEKFVIMLKTTNGRNIYCDKQKPFPLKGTHATI